MEQFLRALGQHHRPLAERDLNSLRAVKQAHLGTSSPPEFNAWDRDFYAEKYLSASNLRSLSPISTFFSVGTVFAGLSRLFDSLYGIRLRARPVRAGEVWSDDVARMDVIDERDGTIGTIYADLYTRPGKPPSAAHYTVRCSRRVDNDDVRADFVLGGAGADEIPGQDTDVRPLEVDPMTLPGREGAYQLPVVVLLCDFVRPTVKEGPSLLSWHEVETLFHEMGHAIHCESSWRPCSCVGVALTTRSSLTRPTAMIGRTEYHNVAGTRCATDFVELPSILMEHFVSCPSVVNLVARHHRTNAALPFSHLQTHLRASRALDSLDTHTQITLAALDQLYHSARAGEKGFDSTRELEALQNRLGVMRGVDGASWQGQFGHLFGYGATYYSYLFDRAIASRVWSRLFAKEPLSREAGERFKTQVLAHGGARDPWEMIASVLEDETVARGDERAMLAVGQWGIADVGVEAQK